MTLDGYTMSQLQDMHTAAYADVLVAARRLRDTQNALLALAGPVTEAALLIAQAPVLLAAAEDKHQHLRAIHLELMRRCAEEDAADAAEAAIADAAIDALGA